MAIESLGGYRLVRKVGEGSRAEVFLAHPIRVSGDPVAIKIFRPDVLEASIMVEIEALSRGAGAHSIELLDLTTDPDGRPALILGRYANGSVGNLARLRPGFRPGEAITILAPMTSALRRLHGNGVAHGAIRPDAVLFDAAGSPTLGCFGSARLCAPGLPIATREAEPALVDDLIAMKSLAIVVLGLVRDDATLDALEWLGHSIATDAGWLDAFDEQLFTLGEPSAVDLRAGPAGSIGTVPSRVLGVGSPAGPAETVAPVGLAIPELLAWLLPPRLLTGEWFTGIRGAISAVRPRFWVAGGAVVVALLAAVLLVPQQQSDAIQAPPDPTTAPVMANPSDGAIAGDDPAAAAVQLLDARETCIRDMSVLCLDGVVQPESAASEADRILIRDIQAGSELPAPWRFDSGQITLDEQLGDSAIVALGDVADDEPASLLLMKSEAGWRIRDYLRQ